MSYVERYSYAGALKSWASGWYYSVKTATSPLVRMVDATVRGREVTHLLGDDYIYNLSWEDPVVDHKVLGLEKDDVICMITTGGDNVLDYLIADPKLIITVDCNAHQNHLLELKIASMKALRREEFFRIFAKSDYELFQRRFPAIAKHMSADAAKYWAEHGQKMRCFLLSGIAHWALYPVKAVFWLAGVNKFIDDSCKGKLSLEGQRALYEDKYEWRLRTATYLMEQTCSAVLAFVGVPKSQVALLPRRYMFASMDYLCRNTRFCENYFYYGYWMGEWTEECCPRYMKPEYYDMVKSRVGRVNIKLGFLHNVLDRDYQDDLITKVTLLDHMDWLTDEQIKMEWMVLQKKCAPGAKLMFRSASEGMPFDALKFLDYKLSTPILPKNGHYVTRYNLPVDRVGTYHSVHMATIPEKLNFNVPTQPKRETTWLKDLKTLRHMYLPKFDSMKHTDEGSGSKTRSMSQSEEHGEWLNNFYRDQADNYDSYRSRMLHGKQELMLRLPIFEGATWLEIGGGTGDSLGYIKNEVPKFKSIEILDLCEELLKVCDSRIKKEGWTNVKTLLQDATTYQPPNNKKYDIITLSYSLTMIPRDKWQAVIDNAYKMLRPGGLLGLADFTVVPSEQNITSRTFWKTLFAVDHVWLSEEHLPYIRSKFEEEVIYGHNKGGFPFIPSAVKCLYYYAIFRKSGGKANFATTLSSADLAKEALQQGEGGYFQRSPRLRAGKGRSKSPARHAGTGGISSN